MAPVRALDEGRRGMADRPHHRGRTPDEDDAGPASYVAPGIGAMRHCSRPPRVPGRNVRTSPGTSEPVQSGSARTFVRYSRLFDGTIACRMRGGILKTWFLSM